MLHQHQNFAQFFLIQLSISKRRINYSTELRVRLLNINGSYNTVLMTQYLSYLRHVTDPAVISAQNAWTSLSHVPCPFPPFSSAQKSWDWPLYGPVAVVNISLFDQNNTDFWCRS